MRIDHDGMPDTITHAPLKIERPWRRMVLVATSAWVLTEPPSPEEPGENGSHAAQRTVAKRRRDDAVERHTNLLTTILEHGAGNAYLALFAELDPTVQFTTKTPQPPPAFATGDRATELINDIAGQLRTLLAGAVPEAMGPVMPAPRHRVVMDATRFEAITGFDPAAAGQAPIPPYFVTLDFRFVRDGQRPCRWHISVAVWSDPPYSPHNIPGPLTEELGYEPDPHQRPLLDQPPSAYHNLFNRVARAAEVWLEDIGHEHCFLRVFGYWHMLPDFFVAVPTHMQADPKDYLLTAHPNGNGLAKHLKELARETLGVDSIADDTIAMSILDGDYLTLRRMLINRRSPAGITGADPLASGDPQLHWERVPLYLIIPGTTPEAETPDWPGVHPDAAIAAAQELAVTSVIDTLTDVEILGAFTLEDAHRDIQVWRNHLAVYEVVASQGSRLWDALSTHLPVGRRFRFGRVHRTIELLHQTLLQGVADLNDLGALSQESLALVERFSMDLTDRFDNGLLQRRIPAARLDIRAALTTTGTIAQLLAGANELQKDAVRVAGKYRDVLGAASMAFDERRVREGDEVQKAAAGLAAILGFVAVVASLSAVAPVSEHLPDWMSRSGLLGWMLGGSIVFAVCSFVFYLSRVARLGNLGTRRFRRHYRGWRAPSGRREGVWHFLKESCTETLEYHRAEWGARPLPENGWSAFDSALAETLAELWDTCTPPRRPPRRERLGADIWRLRRRVGEWSLLALIFTERAWRLHRYPLPQVTLLYRCISRMPGSFLTLPYLGTGQANAVSMAELRRVIANHLDSPYHTQMAWRFAVVDRLDARLLGQRPATAKAALAQIRQELVEERRTLEGWRAAKEKAEGERRASSHGRHADRG